MNSLRRQQFHSFTPECPCLYRSIISVYMRPRGTCTLEEPQPLAAGRGAWFTSASVGPLRWQQWCEHWCTSLCLTLLLLQLAKFSEDTLSSYTEVVSSQVLTPSSPYLVQLGSQLHLNLSGFTRSPSSPVVWTPLWCGPPDGRFPLAVVWGNAAFHLLLEVGALNVGQCHGLPLTF